MRAGSQFRYQQIASFIQETLAKLGMDVDVFVSEDEFEHNETRFLVFTNAFTQLPRIHKSSRILSSDSETKYVIKKSGNYWKYKFDLVIESVNFDGTVNCNRNFLTIKGRYKSRPSNFDRIKAEFTQSKC